MLTRHIYASNQVVPELQPLTEEMIEMEREKFRFPIAMIDELLQNIEDEAEENETIH